MKEIIVKIPDENAELAAQLLEKLGGEIKVKKNTVKKTGSKKTTLKKKNLPEKVSPTFLFGKWKGLDIDATKIRKEAWDRSHKYL